MTNQALPHASPALTALLQEMDESPKSTLFGITPNQLVKGMRGNIDTISARQAGLSNLEEYLLEAHREELALVLAMAAHTRMNEESALDVPLLRWTRGGRWSPAIYSTGQESLSCFDDLPRFIGRKVTQYGSLHALCSRGDSRTLSVLSCRLLSIPHRRLTLGTAMFVLGSYRGARECLLAVLAEPVATTTFRHCLHNASISAWKSKDDALAMRLIGSATTGAGVPPAMWVDSLALAIRANDIEASLHAARGLSDSVSVEHPAFSEGVVVTCAAMASRSRVLEATAPEFAKRLHSALPAVAQEFLDRTFCRSVE
jgi:hypothetical protein